MFWRYISWIHEVRGKGTLHLIILGYFGDVLDVIWWEERATAISSGDLSGMGGRGIMMLEDIEWLKVV